MAPGPQTTVSTPAQASSPVRIARHTVHIVLLWLLFSGHYDPLHLGYGVLSVALVLLLTPHLSRAPGPEVEVSAFDRVRWGRAIAYPWWLLWQIVVANIQVAGLILSRRPPLAPVVIRFRFPVDCRMAKMVLGNSITLTPGTFTVRVRGELFVVHAITREAASTLLNGAMQRRVAAVFGVELDAPRGLELRSKFDTLDGDLRLGDEIPHDHDPESSGGAGSRPANERGGDRP